VNTPAFGLFLRRMLTLHLGLLGQAGLLFLIDTPEVSGVLK